MEEPHLWARPLTPEFADDFFRLHDRPGCAFCYCMYWHFEGDNAAWTKADPKANREAKAKRIAESGDTGMILYEDKEPVGWMQFGPRKHFPKLVALRQPPPGPDDLWCINCVEIRGEKRRQGYARALLAISLEHLQRMGVREVEAYPVAGAHEDGEVWTGPLALFLDAGFRVVKPDDRRPVVRKTL